MSVRVYVFDLDDTLYEEIQFVQSGFRAVAEFLYSSFAIDPEGSYKKMLQLLEKEGRGAVFDGVLKEHNLLTSKNLKKCISVYRGHTPDIKLSNEAEIVLDRLKGKPVYIVTDGNKIVQYNKIRALKLDQRVKKYFITYRYGRIHSKPSPYCFQKIAFAEKAAFEEIVYVGDNPNKDFVGIKPLGIKTIQINQGAFFRSILPEKFQADFQVDNLLDIFQVIKNWETGN